MATRQQPSRTPPRRRTLWEEGHRPGSHVVRGAVTILALTATLDVLLTGQLGWLFDTGFVVVCVAAALWVRPRDFFTVGIMPPLLLAAVVLVLALVDRAAVAEAGDALGQAFVSGLAHRAVALVIGYALTLGLLALRQVALRRGGALRRAAMPTVPSQRTASAATVGGEGERGPDRALVPPAPDDTSTVDVAPAETAPTDAVVRP